MRIAMLGWEFPPFISGGLGVHCYELTQRLAGMGHFIDFYMPLSGKPLASPHPSIRLIETSPSVLKPYFAFNKKGKLATYGEGLIKAVEVYNEQAAQMLVAGHAKTSYDVIHCHDWLTAPGGSRASRLISRPLVQTFHSSEFDRTSTPWDQIVRIERQAAADADLIIAVSRRTRELVMRHLGAEERKIRVVYNGVDASKYRPPSSDASPNKPALAVQTEGKHIVLFLGCLTEQKGPVQFLHAAKKVLEKRPDALFFIAGSGELMPLLISLSMELGLQDHVRFLGYLPEDDQRRIYRAADVYVMPSTSEPFGITALEALASGTPVILSKTSGVGEVVKSALKVDFWDIQGMAQKIISVIQYAPLRKTMMEMAPNDLVHLTWEQTAQQTLAVYEEAVRSFKRPN
ncbi:MAG: glycosyltransferase family 4 protein [Candidatus Marsarchaeota archaeon]|nr:glycosyltransferase family 4 protein [Candidatus Marsarchaeota archaeon]